MTKNDSSSKRKSSESANQGSVISDDGLRSTSDSST